MIVTVSHGSIVTVAKKFWMLTAITAPSMPSLGFPMRPTRELTLDVYGTLAGIFAIAVAGRRQRRGPCPAHSIKGLNSIEFPISRETVLVKLHCPRHVELAERRHLQHKVPQF